MGKIILTEACDKQFHNFDEAIPDGEAIIFRCMKCQNFVLPREIHIARRRVKDMRKGIWTWDIRELCPHCFPNPSEVINHPHISSSLFLRLNREEYEITRAYERAGILPPQFSKNLIIPAVN